MDVLFLKYTGSGDKPSSDVKQIRRVDGVTVVNANLPKTLIVHVRNDDAKCKLMGLHNWSLVLPQTTCLDSDVQRPATVGSGFAVSKYVRSVHK